MKFTMPAKNRHHDDEKFIDTFSMKIDRDNKPKQEFAFSDDRDLVIDNDKNDKEPELVKESFEIRDEINQAKDSDDTNKNLDSSTKVEGPTIYDIVEKHETVEEVYNKINFGKQTYDMVSKFVNMMKNYIDKNVLSKYSIVILPGQVNADESKNPNVIVGNCIYKAFTKVMEFDRNKSTKEFIFPSEERVNKELSKYYRFFDNIYSNDDLFNEVNINTLFSKYLKYYSEQDLLPMEDFIDAIKERMELKAGFLSDEQKDEIINEIIKVCRRENIYREQLNGIDNPDNVIISIPENNVTSEDLVESRDENDEEIEEDDVINGVIHIESIKDNNFTISHDNQYLTIHLDDSLIEDIDNPDMNDYRGYLTKNENFNKYGFLSIFHPWFYLDDEELNKLKESMKDKKFPHGLLIISLSEDIYGVYWLSENLYGFINQLYSKGIFNKIYCDLRDVDIVSQFDDCIEGKGKNFIFAAGAEELLSCFCNENDVNCAFSINDIIMEFDENDYVVDFIVNEDDEEDNNDEEAVNDPNGRNVSKDMSDRFENYIKHVVSNINEDNLTEEDNNENEELNEVEEEIDSREEIKNINVSPKIMNISNDESIGTFQPIRRKGKSEE